VTPLEHAIRAVCASIGANPEGWRGFEEIGRTALEALLAALPPELADGLRGALGLTGGPS
jgi:hypothetical protein